MKKCSACGKTKKNNEFGIASRNKDGRNIYCKPCQIQLYNKKTVAEIQAENGFTPKKKRRIVRKKKVFTSIPVELKTPSREKELLIKIEMLENLVQAQKQTIDVLMNR